MKRTEGAIYWALLFAVSSIVFTGIVWMALIAVTVWTLRWMGLL